MGRKHHWQKRVRCQSSSARIFVPAPPFSLALMAGCFAGLARIRPLVAASTGLIAAGFGFLVCAVLLQLGGREAATLAASVQEVRDVTDTPAVAVVSPPPATVVEAVAEPVRMPPEPGARPSHEQVVRVGKGDTLMKLMMNVGFDKGEAYDAITALREVYDPKRLRIGQAIKLTYAPGDAGSLNPVLIGMRLEKSFDREAGAGRLVDGRFEPFEVEKQLDARMARASGAIRNSLFEDGAAEGVPAKVMVEFIRLFSYDIDFQRDMHVGDSFDLLFERLHGEEGRVAHEGEIAYASLSVGGNTYRLYRYETLDGEVDYFNENGESVRKALLRTPVDGARISSGFGMRRHPILGYSKMHRGIDFAVPSGTPIMAAGSGTVTFAGRKGGYGNYVQLRHNGLYSTAYGHMSGFASGLTRGKKIKQGDIIGYVGSTGRSTGPHLHYEIMEDGDQINPMNLKLPSGTKLTAKDMMRFRLARKYIDERLELMPDSTLIAQAPPSR